MKPRENLRSEGKQNKKEESIKKKREKRRENNRGKIKLAIKKRKT